MMVISIILVGLVCFSFGHRVGARRGYRRGRAEGEMEAAQRVLLAYEAHRDDEPSAQAVAMDKAAWRGVSPDHPFVHNHPDERRP